MTDFLDVSVLPDAPVSADQIALARQRYGWALPFCKGADVLELGCGPGFGWTTLAPVAKTLLLSDYSPAMVTLASRIAGAAHVLQADACALPLPSQSRDVVMLFEALYYVPDAGQFFAEAARVLRPGGKLLLVTSNKDLFDFHPSDHSTRYLGVAELSRELGAAGFSSQFFGGSPAGGGWRVALRALKWAIVGSGLMPRSMAAKRLLRRFVQGSLTPMPHDLTPHASEPLLPWVALPAGAPDRSHRVLMVEATLNA